MKTILKVLFISFFSSFLFVNISSCKKDPVRGCTDPQAENFKSDAEEDDGSCTYAREKFLGNYQGNENCDSGNWSWTMVIATSTSGIDKIILSNLGDWGENIVATVNGSNITFNDTKDGITFSGTGTINGNSLTIIYTASSAGLTDDCTATCIKL